MTLFQICIYLGIPTYEGMSEALPMTMPIRQAKAMGLM
jgi:hypothetical protein